MIRIMIADDHTIVREGLKQILADIPDLAVVEEAKNGEEVIAKVGMKDIDIILLDISLPGRSGLDVLRQLKHRKPGLPVLILSMYPEEQYAVRSIRAGASGYLTKESASTELVEAIRTVVDKPLHELLSDREYQVMCMIASGKTVKEIAKILSLSVKTISTHRSRILKKMNMENNAQLTHYAIKQNLVD
jgi:two-component system invasion response regulator UvrY